MSRRALGLLLVIAAAAAPSRPAVAALPGTFADASDAITAMDLDKAAALLAKLDAKDPKVAQELGRLALYLDDCDTAATHLSAPGVDKLKGSGMLKSVAEGCARGAAGTLVVEDKAFGVSVRLQDDADQALVPLIGETIHKQRLVLERDLGVVMPRPTRVDLVRDQATLAAMTGLPYEAARTTGTVGIAKFGRVIMLSPRAMTAGYGFRDTLAHELTHLALSRGTLDRAPLWLQEGVAKREETRWRDATPIDTLSSPDVLAAKGLDAGLGRPLDGIGPSVAMLPSALEASVVYAEVTSFVRFLSGDQIKDPAALAAGAPIDPTVLPKLVKSLASRPSSGDSNKDVDAALVEVTGKDLKAWDASWRPWVMGKKGGVLPDGAFPDKTKPPKDTAAVRSAFRLGQLLLARKHVGAARKELEPFGADAKDPWVAGLLARARLLGGDPLGARTLVDPAKVVAEAGQFWAVRGDVLRALGGKGPEVLDAYLRAVGHDPFEVEAACGWADVAPEPPEMPSLSQAMSRALCAAAKAEPSKD